MKVIIFGGTGGMGQKVVKELCSYEEIDQVTVAARNPAKFTELKNQVSVNKNKLNFITCDLEQTDLPKVIAGHELVAGAAGPFYKYEKKLASAAITAGVHYFSLCDDYDAEQVFTERGRPPGQHLCFNRCRVDSRHSPYGPGGSRCFRSGTKSILWAGNSDDSSARLSSCTFYIFSQVLCLPLRREKVEWFLPVSRETGHFPGLGDYRL